MGNSAAQHCHVHEQVDVTITAHADKGWPWGVRGMLESAFISQAKIDVEAYLNYIQHMVADLVASGKVCMMLCYVILPMTNLFACHCNGSQRYGRLLNAF